MRYWTNRTNPSRGLIPLLMLCALMLCGLNARGSTLTVSSLADSGAGTLRDQVAAAAPGDTIDFNVTGTITLTNGVIAINKNLNITGPGASSLTVSGYAASIFSISSGIVGLSGLTLSHGLAVNGGAIYMTGGTVTIAGTTISSNHAVQDGGAIYITGGTLAVVGSTLFNNDAGGGSGYGGAISVNGATLTVTSSTISGNLANGGGGILNQGTVTIADSTISGNTASAQLYGFGGGLFNGGAMTIRNSTISGNRSLASGTGFTGGGGIFNQSTTLTIANSTITGNSAEHGGGIKNDGALNLSNTIVAGNTAGSGPDFYGNAGTGDYNLVQNGVSPTGTHNVTGLSALIGPLQNNGGPTLTHALLPGSPALDAGDPNFDPTNTPYDQRGPGFPRIKNGRVCIGAFESELNQSGSSIIVNTLDDHDDGNAGATDCTLREAVKYASAGATITFSVTGTITLTGGEMVITNNLTIIGPANAPGITVSGNNASRIFTVTRGTVNVSTTVQFSTLTLSGGNGAGSINSGNGGAIYIDTFSPPMIVTVTNCTFSGNHATSNGGAIRNGGTLTVTSSTLSSNSASLNAGAIQNGGTLAVTSSTFSGNSTTGTGGNGIGGAIRINAGNLTVTSSTFSGNSASLRGGGIEISTGGTSLSNTIVAGNSAPTGPDINGTVTSGDYNLVQNTAGATLPGTHNITGQPALLGPLASNGGPTQTHSLLSGSPAIDAGDTTLTEDQRGVSRPQGTADDIGAFELQHRPTLSIRFIPLSQVEICWDTVTNRWYQLQYRSTLTTNPWSPLSARIAGGGQRICTNDSIVVGGPQRFYQVGVTNSP